MTFQTIDVMPTLLLSLSWTEVIRRAILGEPSSPTTTVQPCDEFKRFARDMAIGYGLAGNEREAYEDAVLDAVGRLVDKFIERFNETQCAYGCHKKWGREVREWDRQAFEDFLKEMHRDRRMTDEERVHWDMVWASDPVTFPGVGSNTLQAEELTNKRSTVQIGPITMRRSCVMFVSNFYIVCEVKGPADAPPNRDVLSSELEAGVRSGASE